MTKTPCVSEKSRGYSSVPCQCTTNQVGRGPRREAVAQRVPDLYHCLGSNTAEALVHEPIGPAAHWAEHVIESIRRVAGAETWQAT